MRPNWNLLIAVAGLLACGVVMAVHWYQHPRKICADRFGGRNPAWDGTPGRPCPNPSGWMRRL